MNIEQQAKKDLILSSFMYEDFLEDAGRFLISARQCCSVETTDVVVFVKPQVDPKFAKIAHQLQVRLIPVYNFYEDVTRCSSLKLIYRLYLLALRWGAEKKIPGFSQIYRTVASAWVHPTSTRHFAYMDFLKTNPNYRSVLLTDSRDVVFQGNPFEEVNPEVLNVFEQDPSVVYGHPDDFYGKVDTEWTAKMFGNKIVDALNGKRVICAGTIMGSPSILIDYLNYMEREILTHTSHTIDQSIHNKLIYLDLPANYCKVHTNISGTILTLHATDHQVYEIQQQRVKVDGKVVPVLHQYDRIPQLESLFAEIYPVPAI
jgi:hypothetical protein